MEHSGGTGETLKRVPLCNHVFKLFKDTNKESWNLCALFAEAKYRIKLFVEIDLSFNGKCSLFLDENISFSSVL